MAAYSGYFFEIIRKGRLHSGSLLLVQHSPQPGRLGQRLNTTPLRTPQAGDYSAILEISNSRTTCANYVWGIWYAAATATATTNAFSNTGTFSNTGKRPAFGAFGGGGVSAYLDNKISSGIGFWHCSAFRPSSPVSISSPSPVFTQLRQPFFVVSYSPTTACCPWWDEQPDRFLNVDLKSLQLHLDHLSDKGLAETLKHGIAYYHEALSKQDKLIQRQLCTVIAGLSGANSKSETVRDRGKAVGVAQNSAVLISGYSSLAPFKYWLQAKFDTAWSLPVTSYMVVIMGVQYFEGKEHRYIDYPVMDVLQMMGRACRPTEDDISRCVLMCQQTRKDFYRKFLAEGLPIVSHLPTHMLHDYFLAEIATYFYRRMMQNPNYYNLHNVSHQHLSDHLSELVENTLSDLVNSKCIAIDEMDVSPLNLGMIAAYYNISYVTVEVYTLSLKERTKLKGLLEVMSSSAEFESIPIRRHEETLLRRIYERVPVKLEHVDFEAPHFKTFLLLQAHFSRIQLPPDLAADQALVLEKIPNLLSACVDIMSSNAWLNTLGAMDLSQMCIPHFDDEARCGYVCQLLSDIGCHACSSKEIVPPELPSSCKWHSPETLTRTKKALAQEEAWSKKMVILQANDDFAMGAPSGTPGAIIIDTTMGVGLDENVRRQNTSNWLYRLTGASGTPASTGVHQRHYHHHRQREAMTRGRSASVGEGPLAAPGAGISSASTSQPVSVARDDSEPVASGSGTRSGSCNRYHNSGAIATDLLC
ncbi:Sec63 Brl domain containing protein [Amanita muscaria]